MMSSMEHGLEIVKGRKQLYIVGALIVIVLSMLSGIYLTSEPEANAVVAGASSTNKNAHRDRCDGAGHPFVDFSLQIQDVQLNTNNGNVNYTAEVKYQACRNNTRAYAIYGRNFCEVLGPYATPGDGSNLAHDCVKYIGNPGYQAYGTALTCGGGRTNDACLFQPQVWRNRGYIVEEAQPPTSPERTVKTTFSGLLTVPNWDTKKQRTGNHEFDIDGIICQYYKFGNNFSNDTADGGDEQKRCINNTKISVSWTAEWSVSPSNSMSVNGVQRGNDTSNPFVVYVGDSVNWSHRLVNSGPEDMASNVSWTVYQGGTIEPSGQRGIYNFVWPAYKNVNDSISRNESFSPQPSHAGRSVCQANSATPRSYNNGSYIGTNWLCVRVVYYRITPTINDVPDIFVGEPADVTGSVAATGVVEGNHEVRISGYRYNDTRILNSGRLNARPSSGEAPCSVNELTTAPGYGECKVSTKSIPNFNGSPNPQGVSSTFEEFDFSGPYPVGSTFCFVVSVKDPTENPNDDDNWYHSTVDCTTSAKKPRVQFLGSDARVAGNATSSPYSVKDTTYGSWAEYGMFTLGVNNRVGSGNGLRGGNTGGTVASWNRLTFANTPSYGGYSPMPVASSAYAYFSSLAPSGGSLNANTIPNGVYDVGSSVGNTLDKLPDAKGASVILRHDGTFNISRINNIRVNNQNLTKASDITQVVIVADNIVIDDDVDIIDAWLVTPPDGSIITCRAGGRLTASKCSTPLRVNGAIYTGQLKLRRTAGANPPEQEQLSTPAEQFHLGPESQLWAYSYANKSDYAQTDYVQELPPRY